MKYRVLAGMQERGIEAANFRVLDNGTLEFYNATQKIAAFGPNCWAWVKPEPETEGK